MDMLGGLERLIQDILKGWTQALYKLGIVQIGTELRKLQSQTSIIASSRSLPQGDLRR
jgi:hypothetical protein